MNTHLPVPPPNDSVRKLVREGYAKIAQDTTAGHRVQLKATK
jgi:hypothetical protein